MNVSYFDLEWANSKNRSICQIALICEDLHTKSPVFPEQNIYVNPEDEFDSICSSVHNINRSKIKDCKNFSSLWPEIEKYFTKSVIVGHNVVSADLHALVLNLKRYNIDIPDIWYIDTYSLTRKLIPFGLPNYKLSSLCDYFNINFSNHHDAFSDAQACADLLNTLIDEFNINIEDYIKKFEPNIENLKSFTPLISPLEYIRELNILVGTINGIGMDNIIVKEEKEFLIKWQEDHANYKNHAKLEFIYSILEQILKDGIVTIEELNILNNEVLKLMKTVSSSQETSSIQQLQGIISGIVCDNNIKDIEILKMKSWLYNNNYLKGNYPYDKIVFRLEEILIDNIITRDEKESLCMLFDELFNPLDYLKNEEIVFNEKSFCLSGTFNNGSKADIEQYIKSKGGSIDKNVKRSTQYIVVGGCGSKEYSNGTFGTKVKKGLEFGVDILAEDELYKMS